MNSIRIEDSEGNTLARPVTLHGAAVSMRRFRDKWKLDGVTGVVVTIDGVAATKAQLDCVDGDWRKYL